MLVYAHAADDEVDIGVCGKVVRRTIGFGSGRQMVCFYSSFGSGDGGVAQGGDLVLCAIAEIGEVGPDGPGLRRGEADEANSDRGHDGRWDMVRWV